VHKRNDRCPELSMCHAIVSLGVYVTPNSLACRLETQPFPTSHEHWARSPSSECRAIQQRSRLQDHWDACTIVCHQILPKPFDTTPPHFQFPPYHIRTPERPTNFMSALHLGICTDNSNAYVASSHQVWMEMVISCNLLTCALLPCYPAVCTVKIC
jgi:hypothetical protein